MGIARAVIHKPALLLADEPTGNLHSSQAKEIMELFRELNQQGTTIVQVTHSEVNASTETERFNCAMAGWWEIPRIHRSAARWRSAHRDLVPRGSQSISERSVEAILLVPAILLAQSEPPSAPAASITPSHSRDAEVAKSAQRIHARVGARTGAENSHSSRPAGS